MWRQKDPSAEDLSLPTSDMPTLADSTSCLVNASFSLVEGEEAALRFPKCDLANDPLMSPHIAVGPFLLFRFVATPAPVLLHALRSASGGRDILLGVDVRF